MRLLVYAALAACSAGAPEDAASTLPPVPESPHVITRAGIELGRRLFFDPRLSGNDRIACATCHDPARAFTDGVGLATHGASGKRLARNAPALTNIAWATSLFWDGGAKNLESMTFGPIIHADEMGEDLERMMGQLSSDPEMRTAFARAFPRQEMAPGLVMRALAQYMRSLVSDDSRYDRYVRGAAALSLMELRGLAVHQQKCASCHSGALFTDNGFHDIGLDAVTALERQDPGRGRVRITFRPEDERAFRTPTLRNLSYTAPYMHDGRFATLDDVLDHYRHGIHATPTLASELRELALTADDARDLRAFLGTLDDHAFVTRHVMARMGLRSKGR